MQHPVLNNLNISVLSVDQGLRLCYINPSAESLLEISGNRGLKQPISSFFLNAADLEPILFEALQSGQMYTRRKVKLDLFTGRSVTCDYSITPYMDAEKPRLLLELYPLDRYLRIDRDESISTHTEVTRQMVRGLAHEIKNPLGGIRGSAQLLARELKTDQLRQYTDVIIDETDRLTSLVDRLLGPNSALKPECMNIHEVLERVRTLIAMESDPPIEIHQDYDPSIPEMNLDAELMVQVVLNIARNAMQSLVDINTPKITFISRVERQYTIGSIHHKLAVRMSVQDNGPGIPEALKEHLFFPMISGRSNGTGLGLSVAQAIIQQHHGLIEFDSEPGNTTFSIILPLETSA
ncbi:MAG: PAS domain-containing protein [Pseudomonadales bacterium]|nr:PAS domain-containing protein [Pseudomonadales bacterium]